MRGLRLGMEQKFDPVSIKVFTFSETVCKPKHSYLKLALIQMLQCTSPAEQWTYFCVDLVRTPVFCSFSPHGKPSCQGNTKSVCWLLGWQDQQNGTQTTLSGLPF